VQVGYSDGGLLVAGTGYWNPNFGCSGITSNTGLWLVFSGGTADADVTPVAAGCKYLINYV